MSSRGEGEKSPRWKEKERKKLKRKREGCPIVPYCRVRRIIEERVGYAGPRKGKGQKEDPLPSIDLGRRKRKE